MAEPNESDNRSNRKRNNLIEEEMEGAKNASSLVIETAGKKRKKKRRKEGDDDDNMEDMDPLVVFGSDIMLMILSYLDARSVALSLLVSRRWHGVASSDRLWTLKVTLFPSSLPLFLLSHSS